MYIMYNMYNVDLASSEMTEKQLIVEKIGIRDSIITIYQLIMKQFFKHWTRFSIHLSWNGEIRSMGNGIKVQQVN